MYKNLKKKQAAYYVVMAFMIAFVALGLGFVYSGLSCHDAGMISRAEASRREIIGFYLLLIAIPAYFVGMCMKVSVAKAHRLVRREEKREQMIRQKEEKLFYYLSEVSSDLTADPYKSGIKTNSEEEITGKYFPFMWTTCDGKNWTGTGVGDDTITENP